MEFSFEEVDCWEDERFSVMDVFLEAEAELLLMSVKLIASHEDPNRLLVVLITVPYNRV